MESDQQSEVLVSFIIPHHGRDQMLIDTVSSIAAQQVEGNIEVLIMSRSDSTTNDSDYETLRESITKLVKNGAVDIFTIPIGKTISFGRNAGASRAAGKYLAFVDADVRLAPNWVTEMISALNASHTALLSGAVQQADDDRADVDVIKSSMSQANAGLVNALPGNALFIEKSVFDSYPKFPEHLETCEDWVFTNTLSMHGDVVLTDQTHFVHLGEDKTYRTLFRKEIWRGTSNLGSINGRKIELAEWPSFIVPVIVGGGLIISLMLFLFGQFLPSTAIFLCSLVIPALYTIRLKQRSRVPVALPKLLYFYLVYFSARAVGMMKGLLSGETLRESTR